jgi:hypothetical protein
LGCACSAGCMEVRYCSRECQLEDWEDGHKHECTDVSRPGPTRTNKLIHLSLSLGEGSFSIDRRSYTCSQ